MEGAADVKAQIAPGQIILEAARRLQAPEIVTKVLGDLDRPLAMSAHARVAVQKLTLSPTDGFLLSRIDGVAHRARDLPDHPAAPGGRGAQPLRAAVHGDGGVRDAHGVQPRARGRGRARAGRPGAHARARAAGRGRGPARRAAAAPGRARRGRRRQHATRRTRRGWPRRGTRSEGRAAARRRPRPGRDRGARPRPRAAPRRREHPRARRAGPRLHDDAQAARPRGRRPHGGDPRQPEGSRACTCSSAACTRCAGTATPAIASFRKALEMAPGHAEAQAELDAVTAAPQEPPKTGRMRRGSRSVVAVPDLIVARLSDNRRMRRFLALGLLVILPACGGSDPRSAREPQSAAASHSRAGSHADPEPVRRRLRQSAPVLRGLLRLRHQGPAPAHAEPDGPQHAAPDPQRRSTARRSASRGSSAIRGARTTRRASPATTTCPASP